MISYSDRLGLYEDFSDSFSEAASLLVIRCAVLLSLEGSDSRSLRAHWLYVVLFL